METTNFECIDPEVGQLLPLLEEGLLEGEEQSQLVSHLEACQRCAEDRGSVRELISAIKGLPPDALGSEWPAMVTREPRRMRSGSWLAAAVVLTVGLGGLAWSGWREVALTGQIGDLERRLARLEVEQRTAENALLRENAAGTAVYAVRGPTFVRPPNF